MMVKYAALAALALGIVWTGSAAAQSGAGWRTNKDARATLQQRQRKLPATGWRSYSDPRAVGQQRLGTQTVGARHAAEPRGVVPQYYGAPVHPGGTPRDPTGILRGQGVSSLYGGMGGMGGGRGLSANTGIGLGGLGASQGARN